MIIKELIERLKLLPENKIVVILDADTGWFLNISEITEIDKLVYIRGFYNDEILEQEIK